MSYIFHKHIVVGDNTYFTDTKMGAKIHGTVALRLCMRMYIMVKFIGAEKNLRAVFLGKIFYKHNVVGNDTYFIDTKMGGRTSLFLRSQRMPSRYVLLLQVYRMVEFIGV